jgi:hypothetical protein
MASANAQERRSGSHGSSTNVSKPCARFVARETSGLLDTPIVVMPASAATSGHVRSASASQSPPLPGGRVGAPADRPVAPGRQPGEERRDRRQGPRRGRDRLVEDEPPCRERRERRRPFAADRVGA